MRVSRETVLGVHIKWHRECGWNTSDEVDLRLAQDGWFEHHRWAKQGRLDQSGMGTAVGTEKWVAYVR